MRIPVKAASAVGKAYGLRQVIMVAWDGTLTHVVTWGRSVEDCAAAAAFGNELKKKWGWPDDTIVEPTRVKKLQDEVVRLTRALESSEIRIQELEAL